MCGDVSGVRMGVRITGVRLGCMGLVGGVRVCWPCERRACRLVLVSSHATAELIYIYIYLVTLLFGT